MPFYHIALFKTKEGATQVDVDKALDYAKSLPAEIPCLLSMESGKATAMALTHGHGFEWGVIARFNNLEDFGAYQQHPAQKGIFPLMGKAFAETLLFDFEA